MIRTLTPPSNTITKNIFEGCYSHKHKLWELVFFIDGECKHKIMDNTFYATTGDVFLVGPTHVHEIEPIKNKHCHRDLYFCDEQVKSICSLIKFDNLYQNICDNIMHINLSNSTLNMIINQLKTVEVHYELSKINTSIDNIKISDVCISVCNSILNFLLNTYILRNFELSPQQPQWIIDILTKFKSPEYFTKKPIDIIKNSGYSHSRFSELFKKHVGMSLIDYIVNKRLSYASDLLLTTDKSTLEISTIVGYNSYSCFVKLFKKRFNVSPIQYRKQNI